MLVAFSSLLMVGGIFVCYGCWILWWLLLWLWLLHFWLQSLDLATAVCGFIGWLLQPFVDLSICCLAFCACGYLVAMAVLFLWSFGCGYLGCLVTAIFWLPQLFGCLAVILLMQLFGSLAVNLFPQLFDCPSCHSISIVISLPLHSFCCHHSSLCWCCISTVVALLQSFSFAVALLSLSLHFHGCCIAVVVCSLHLLSWLFGAVVGWLLRLCGASAVLFLQRFCCRSHWETT